MAHTPGPWRIKKYSYGFWVVSDEKRENITWIGHPSYPPRDNEANARLIATAPELLEALESTIEWIDSAWPDVKSLDWEDWRQTVSKIVAKARGEGDA